MNVLGLTIKRNKPKGKRAYEAADKGRRSKAFRLAQSTGANREIAGALVTLRDRSRHMVRNNGWAKRAVEAIVKHTVGEGIRPAPIGSLTQIKSVKKVWRRWAESTDCDFYGKTNFYGLQELAMRSLVEGGDMLIVKRRTKDGVLPIKLQLCEGDLLDHTRNGINDNGVARLGVQHNKEGVITGFWIFDHHPSDGGVFGLNRESKFIDKSDVLHVYEVLRIGQCRGVPFGVSSFMKLGDFGVYEDAQLTKQKVAACFAAFVSGSDDVDEDKEPLENLEPGIIERLGPSETVAFADPPTVGDYESYTTRILQGIAAAYGITYEMLTMDYSKVNFTSGRMAKIDVTGNFRSWQYNMLVPQLCAPVWRWFVESAIIAGKLKAEVEADWTAPRVQQLDPVKETNAQVTQIKNGLTTLSEVIRETGREPEEFFAEYTQDAERIKKFGISVESIAALVENDNAKSTAEKPDGDDKKPKGESKSLGGSEPKAENKPIGEKPKTEMPKEQEQPKEEPREIVPAIEFGVDGTQGMIEVVTNNTLTVEQKIGILVEWFKLGEEKAKKMLAM